METTTTKEIPYTGREYTGRPEIDSKIDALRKHRDQLTEESSKCQKQIDELFLEAMTPDFKKGDYIRWEHLEQTTIARVVEVRRLYGGIAIEIDLAIRYIWGDREDELNKDIDLYYAENYTETLHIRKEDLHELSRSSREEFLGITRRRVEEILSKATEKPNEFQLKLNL